VSLADGSEGLLMLKRSLGLLLVVCCSLAACSAPECRDDEIKIGTTCLPDPSNKGRDAAVEAATGLDGASPANASEAGRRDAALDEDEDDNDRDASQPAPSDDAGRPDAGTVTTAPPDAGCEANGTCPPSCIPSPEVCDSKDNNCNGMVDEANVCAPACVPAAEVCDLQDNDCDGQVDEDPPTWYRDCDNDGAPVLMGAQKSCTKPTLSGCVNFLEQMPVTPDCNDGDSRYYPGAIPKTTTSGPNENEEKKYLGDMNCNGVVEKPKSWDYWDDLTGTWVSAAHPLCLGTESCDVGGQPCYENSELPGQPIGCGNTEVSIKTFDGCGGGTYVARLVCK
jgi:hypothetical protein